MMKFTRLAGLLIATLWPGGAAARGEDARALTLAVPPGVKVTVPVPKGWLGSVDHSIPNAPAQVKLNAQDGAAAMEMVFATDWKLATTSRAKINQQVYETNGALAELWNVFVEKDVTLVEMKAKPGLGAYSVFTRGNLAKAWRVPKGEFRYEVFGLFVIKAAGVVFDLHVNDLKGREFQEAMKLIEEGVAADAAK